MNSRAKRALSADQAELLRQIPSVDELLQHPRLASLASRVDRTLRTSVSHIWAAGDVIGFPSLAATSMEQGRLASCDAFGIRSLGGGHVPRGQENDGGRDTTDARDTRKRSHREPSCSLLGERRFR